ncbi:hypothetical protein ASPFODRAFT_369284 [Aspergillus luchuensis CBS 106.47]|uniref:Uncharacterized protein n=1 Tax=Aspergillus luchuensis (strain CBS 106.47) TaxID=1137211 RepID=A0A1M3T5E9_ASPLC|nr:hypothetical protein ASPFODRAFT_369284 [Aspergillus luchuensis CBS 106.47]
MIQRFHRGPGYRSVSDSLVSPAYSIPNRPWSRRSGGAADAGLAPLMLGLCLDGRQTRFSLMSGEPAGKSLFVVWIFYFLFFFLFWTWKVKLFLGLGSCQLFFAASSLHTTMADLPPNSLHIRPNMSPAGLYKLRSLAGAPG